MNLFGGSCGNNGNSCLWILIILVLLSCCGNGCGSICGNSCISNNCGNNCCD